MSLLPLACRVLTEDDGFAPIDDSKVALIQNPSRATEAVKELAEMIREAFQPPLSLPGV